MYQGHYTHYFCYPETLNFPYLDSLPMNYGLCVEIYKHTLLHLWHWASNTEDNYGQ